VKWILKAALQRGLSLAPRAEALNYVLQRHVTHGLPVSDGILGIHLDAAQQHLHAVRRFAPALAIEEARFYEFGAGWDLVVPLAYYCLGVQAQTLIDIRPHVRLDLIDDAVARIDRRVADAGGEGPWRRRLDPRPVRSIDDLRERYGISYLAPRDARQTGLPQGSFDVITSTVTLEHIPAADILTILRECRRLLPPGGVLTSEIDMKDHYSYFDPSISPYNFLKFPEWVWWLGNSPLHYQNRLRAPDYLRLFEQAGMRLLDTVIRPATAEDRAVLEGMRVTARFRERYSLDELGARSVHVVCTGEPRPTTVPS
jgi:SAM-dependent methyltransferase